MTHQLISPLPAGHQPIKLLHLSRSIRAIGGPSKGAADSVRTCRKRRHSFGVLLFPAKIKTKGMFTIVNGDSLLYAALTGLLGAPHCIAMCGGTAAGLALNAGAGAFRTVLAYNLGRWTTYIGLGALMGAIGSFVDVAGSMAGVQGIASMAGGVFILLWAFRKYTLPLADWGPMRLPFLKQLSMKLRQSNEAGAVYGSGVLLGFIPCGMTYAMQMNAAASGGAWTGALLMAVFGLATFPALFFAGLFAGAIQKSLRGKLLRLGQWVAVWIGVLLIVRGLSANGWFPPF